MSCERLNTAIDVDCRMEVSCRLKDRRNRTRLADAGTRTTIDTDQPVYQVCGEYADPHGYGCGLGMRIEIPSLRQPCSLLYRRSAA